MSSPSSSLFSTTRSGSRRPRAGRLRPLDGVAATDELCSEGVAAGAAASGVPTAPSEGCSELGPSSSESAPRRERRPVRRPRPDCQQGAAHVRQSSSLRARAACILAPPLHFRQDHAQSYFNAPCLLVARLPPPTQQDAGPTTRPAPGKRGTAPFAPIRLAHAPGDWGPVGCGAPPWLIYAREAAR